MRSKKIAKPLKVIYSCLMEERTKVFLSAKESIALQFLLALKKCKKNSVDYLFPDSLRRISEVLISLALGLIWVIK